ncbi:MAG: adenylate/guanylate cyclase domain-containing protein [Gemmatimonadota bacterium]|nr:adenylate/guanylate cyclase domain-containing protein [Gemmatimonadota bacterium]
MASRRTLQTVLFTDIVGSTERATQLGDRAWYELLQEHHTRVRREIRRFGGRELNTAGDGFLAAFDRPASAIRCAWAIRATVRQLGLEVRSGLHAGEVQGEGREVGGIAVHIGSRVAAEADPGQIVVTSTVRQLVTGAGFRFEALGRRELAGVSEEWEIYALEGLPSDSEASATGGFPLPASRRAGIVGGIAVTLVVVSIVVASWTSSSEPTRPEALPGSERTRLSDRSPGEPGDRLEERPLVVMMDSPHPSRVYDEETRAVDGTNADVISDILLDLPVLRQKETIGPDWHRDQEILKFDPELVVIHYSGFRQGRDEGPRERLRLFIEYFAETDTKFLVYSRQPEEQLRQRLETLLAPVERKHPGILDRVRAFGVTDYGPPRWKNPMTANRLKLAVKEILELQ